MKKEILIVEGHLYLQKTLIDWLEKIYPEFEILAADSCEDAIDTVQASPPSLMIMDSHLTQIDGFETMRRIKADHPRIPILIMADFDCDLNKEYAFSAGADAYLLKDSIQTKLLPIIDRLLDRTLKGALKSSMKNYLKEENVMMNKAMYEDVARQWQNLFLIPFPVSGMDKQKESFLALYKVEQENFQTFVTACQNYFKSIGQIGEVGDIGKLWQNYLDSSQTLVTSLDSCRQHRQEAFFSFFQDLMSQIPTRTAATKQ